MFMQPQCIQGSWVQVETRYVVDVVEAEYLDDALSGYGGDVLEVGEPEEGWCARLSAPGYMDCTDWCGPFDTPTEAALELFYLHGPQDDDDSDRNDWESFLARCARQEGANHDDDADADAWAMAAWGGDSRCYSQWKEEQR